MVVQSILPQHTVTGPRDLVHFASGVLAFDPPH